MSKRRKALSKAKRLAEMGCSTHQIAAITGSADLKVERYFKAADGKRRKR